MAGPIRIAILAAAAAATRQIREVGEATRRMGRDADGADGPVRRMSKSVGELTGKAVGAVRSVGAVIAPIAGMVSAAIAAAPALAGAGAALLNVARAAGGAAPALAAIAAAAIFVKLTLARIAPFIANSLDPITKAFDRATQAAGKLAAQGVRPLARDFAKVGVPIVADAMNQIATSTNLVVKGFLNWAKSTPGLVALRKVTSSAADAFADVAPHVLQLAIALGEMLGRISGVSLAAGSKGLAGVLDAVTAKLKTITAKSVQDGLDVLRKTFESVRSAVVKVGEVIGIAIGIYRKYQAEIMVISDVLAILAIVFGGPVTAIIAAVGLIVRHLDTVKAAVAQVREVFAKPGPVAFIDNLRTVVSTVWPVIVDAFNQIKAAVLPTLLQITDKIRKDLIPAIGEFLAAAAPVVAFFIERFAPIIATALQTVVKIISAAVTIITGIFKVLTGILTGDWSKTWAGIKQILSGALSAIKALISGAFSVLRSYFGAINSGLSGIWRGLWALIRDVVATAIKNVTGLVAGLAVSLRNALSIDLSAAGRKIIQTLINGIRSKAGEVVGVVSNIAKSVRDHFPFSPAKRGPLKKKPMTRAGENIVRDLAKGMRRRTPDAIFATRGLARGISEPERFDFTGAGRTPSLYRPPGNPISINFGVVGDPVAAGRAVEKVLNQYRAANGRAGLA